MRFYYLFIQKVFSAVLLAALLPVAIPAQARRGATRTSTASTASRTSQASRCKGGWSGSITFKKTLRNDFSDKVKNITRGTTEHVKVRRYDYAGRIQVADWHEFVPGIAAQRDNQAPVGQVTFRDEDKNFKRSERKDTCFYDGRGPRDQFTHEIDNRVTNGFAEGKLQNFDLVVNRFNGTYSLSFHFPEANGVIDRELRTTNGGFCNEKLNGTTDNSRKTPTRIPGAGETVENQKIDPKNPDVLSGSVTHDTSVNKDGKSFIYTVTWNLRRCPAPLELEAVEFDEHPFPDWKSWRKVDGETIDGNVVRVRARVTNYSAETKFPKLNFRELRADLELPGSETNVSLAPGESREIEYLWDTSGWAWETNSTPASERQVKVELTEPTVPKKSLTGDILIIPRPVILAHGLWADYTSWNGYDLFFKQAHSTAWSSFAIGKDPANGRMKTGEKGLPTPTDSIAQNAAEMAKQITFARKEKNAWHVDVVAHSMGGLVSRYYIQNLMENVPDGRPLVSRLVQLGTPNMGSPCANLMGFVFWSMGKPVTSLDELRPLTMENFNRAIRNRRGTKFSVLIGTGLPQTCQSSVSGDGVVEIPSARWEIRDHRYVADLHTALTDRMHFTNFVLPRLAVNHRLNRNPEPNEFGAKLVDDLRDVDSAPFVNASFDRTDDGAPVLPPNLKIELARQTIVAAGQTTEIEIPAPGGGHAGLTFIAPPTVSATLIDAAGKVAGQNLAGTSEARADFRSLRVPAAAGGVWKLKLANTAATEAGAVVALWTDRAGAPFEFELGAGRPNAEGRVALTAKLTENGAPLAGGVVKAQLVAGDGRTTALALVDDGLHGDGARDDGVYGATTERLASGDYSVGAEAEITGRPLSAAISLKIGAETKKKR